MATWQLTEAKARLGEVIERSRSEGPQEITRHGRRVAVVLSADAWDRCAASRGSLVSFLDRSPLCGAKLEIERPRGRMRKGGTWCGSPVRT